jgi:hypothetical protein
MRLTAVVPAFLALGLTGASTAFAADPQLMNLVMPDAKVLAGINVTSAKISPLGQFLISRLNATNPQLNGIAPMQDVTEILAASTANSAAPGGLIAMRGTFDPGKIIATLAAAPKAPVYQVQAYAGATLITFTTKAKVSPAVAFIGGTVAIAGDAPTVTAALDRSAGNNAIDPALAVQVSALSGTEDAWFVSTVSPSLLFPAKAPTPTALNNTVDQIMPFFAAVQGFSGGIKFGDTVPVTLDIVANSDKNAEALANVAKFAISMLAMNTGQSAAQDPTTAAALKLLQTLQVNTTGSTVDLALTIPEAQIESLISALPGAPRKPAAAKPAKAN